MTRSNLFLSLFALTFFGCSGDDKDSGVDFESTDGSSTDSSSETETETGSETETESETESETETETETETGTDTNTNTDTNTDTNTGTSTDCGDVDSLNPGDLVITEVMKNPCVIGEDVDGDGTLDCTVEDVVGEWFEIHNASGSEINLCHLESHRRCKEAHRDSSGHFSR